MIADVFADVVVEVRWEDRQTLPDLPLDIPVSQKRLTKMSACDYGSMT
jgi:hypothetical protein